MSEVPGWLSALLSEKRFFGHCTIHIDAKKNEMNTFCLDCCTGICPHCVTDHPSHRLLQIRRYMYQEVIKIEDAGIINCDQIQTYITNHAKVVFLNQRPPKHSSARDSGRICSSCDRFVPESSLYCCLSCKLKKALRSGGRIKPPINLESCEFPDLPAGSDEVQMTPVSVLDPAGSMRTESGCSSGCPYLSSTEATEVVQKECTNASSAGRTGPGSAKYPSFRRNRRKGTPHRSPRN